MYQIMRKGLMRIKLLLKLNYHIDLISGHLLLLIKLKFKESWSHGIKMNFNRFSQSRTSNLFNFKSKNVILKW